MHSDYKTQCPHCHTIYPLPEALYGKTDARANCGSCHHIFFPNQYIIDATAEQSTQSHEPDINTPSFDETQIFDNMSITESATPAPSFSADELNQFLNTAQTIASQPVNYRTPTDNNENWIDELLKEDKQPTISASPVKVHANDDLSGVIGTDLDNIIPAAPAPHEDYKNMLKKVRQRIESHPPTQEQLMTRRSLGSKLGWALGCALMVALLGIQYIIFNLDNIIKNPKHLALLSNVCTVIPCNLPSANSQAFSTTYTLKAGRADYTTDVLITLKNTSGNDQLHPNLKISVYGDNKLLGDLIATPKDYLVSHQRLITSTQDRQLMLTLVDITHDEIRTVTIEPFY